MNMNRWIIFPELCLYSTRHNELDNGILSSFLNKKQKHYKSLVFIEKDDGSNVRSHLFDVFIV